jgi:1,2-diacylglycerol 3-alpha-glucosyltransferase
MHIVAITTVTSPYIVSRYRCFQVLNPHHQLTLLEFGKVSTEYAWIPTDDDVPYNRIVLSEIAIQSLAPKKRITLISSALSKIKPDVLVVCGYGVIGMMVAIYWAQNKRRNLPLVLLSDSKADDRSRTRAKEGIKKRIIARFGAVLVAGTKQRDYMLSLGMPENRIFLGYDVVDNDYFWNSVQKSPEENSILRKKHQLPQNYFLTCARFLRSESGITRVKNLHRLIKAYEVYIKKTKINQWGLVILGDGELRFEIEAQISKMGLIDHVILPGFKQYHELPIYYGLADVFILASIKETWGLVVNEAMASGLPVLISKNCGCAADLVKNGCNGFTFDPYDTNMLANLMLKMASDGFNRASMGQASRDIIKRWTPVTFSENLQQAVNIAIESPKSNPKIIDKFLMRALCCR